MLKRMSWEKNKKNASSKKGKNNKTLAMDGPFTKNIVFKEVLTLQARYQKITSTYNAFLIQFKNALYVLHEERKNITKLIKNYT